MSRIDHNFDHAAVEQIPYPASRFRASFDHAPVGMAHVAPDGQFLLVNDQFCAVAGHSRHTLLTYGFQQITHPDDLASDMIHVQQLLDGKADRYTMEKRYIREDGHVVWVNLIVSLIRDRHGAPDFFIAVIEDLSEIKQAQAEAILDPLTGLLNRRGLFERLDQEIIRAKDTRSALSLIYLDLDDFKTINDTLGHLTGDECLLQTAEALAAGARFESAAARIGGDEFIMILPRTNHCQLALAAERVRTAVNRAIQGCPWPVTASLGGVSLIPSQALATPLAMIEAADQAMFQAKRAGKNHCHLVEW